MDIVSETNKFGNVLKEQRQGHGWTQRELASRLGVKASHIAYLETGQRKPSLGLINRISDTLHLDRQRLFVLAHPEAKSMMPTRAPSRSKSPAEAWRALLNDRALLRRYQVSKRELQALKGLNMLGFPLTKREFVAIVTLIRKDADED